MMSGEFRVFYFFSGMSSDSESQRQNYPQSGKKKCSKLLLLILNVQLLVPIRSFLTALCKSWVKMSIDPSYVPFKSKSVSLSTAGYSLRIPGVKTQGSITVRKWALYWAWECSRLSSKMHDQLGSADPALAEDPSQWCCFYQMHLPFKNLNSN